MSSWIPGYEILEGPERTGVPLRFTARRLSDGALAWIRVDAYVPNDLRAAVALARVYQLTARFEHPELPDVLGYGATTIQGRPYIAYHLAPRRRVRPSAATADALATVVEILAELQLLSYEAGTAGLHLPERELVRAGALERVEGRRLPAREYLAEPRRGDGASGFARVLPDEEWTPFTAPERRGAVGGRGRVASVRQAVSYRLAAQAYAAVTGRACGGQPGPGEFDPPPGLGGAVPWSSIVAGFDARPERRPALEAFLSLGVCA